MISLNRYILLLIVCICMLSCHHSFLDAYLVTSSQQADLLPSNHWLMAALDEIFSQPHILDNEETFQQAGFQFVCQRPRHIRVARHQKLPGYLVKLYLKCDKPSAEQGWRHYFTRCEGVRNIRNLIQEKKLKYFTVPDKWVYAVPGEEYALLVVTDMRLVSDRASIEAWKERIKPQHLKELYCILSHGYASCYLPFNIPYTKDRTFTCIDTAYPQRTHHLEKVKHYLSDEMRLYWDKLVKKGQ